MSKIKGWENRIKRKGRIYWTKKHGHSQSEARKINVEKLGKIWFVDAYDIEDRRVFDRQTTNKKDALLYAGAYMRAHPRG